MVVGNDLRRADVLVVGGGPGGYTAAADLGRRGRDVLLVDDTALGGVCLNVGCIPSKALLHLAELVAGAREGAGWGVMATVELDMARARKRIEEAVDELAAGVRSALAGAGVEVLAGRARLEGPGRAVVSTAGGPVHVECEALVLATGSRPVELPGLPFDGARVLDSSDALALDVLPPSLAIVGGGYIGVELATAFAKLGSAVTVLEAADHLLPGFDRALVRPVAVALADRGVELLTGATVHGLDGSSLSFSTVAGEGCRDVDTTVVAVGRRPSTDDLGLDTVGVVPIASGHLDVDVQGRVAPGIWALGDVTSGPALAHRATAQAEVVARAIVGDGAAFEPACIPSVVYSDPEIVSVGATLTEARATGLWAERAVRPFRASGRAVSSGRGEGRAEVVYDSSDGRVLGVHLVGAGVAELAGEAALAIEMCATVTDLALTIHAHPSLAESLQEAARDATTRDLHPEGNDET